MIFNLRKRLIIKYRYNYSMNFYNYAAQNGLTNRTFYFFSYLCNTMEGQDDYKQGHFLLSRFMNKYTMTLFIFLVWLAFFDRNNLVEKAQLKSKITTLKKEKAYYQQKIEEDNRKMQELLSNKDNLEKFAREQYLMKNKNEDIFVIVNQ